MRQTKPTPTKADDLVRFYMRAEHAEGVFGDVGGAGEGGDGGGGDGRGGGGAGGQDRASDETLALLEQLLEMRALILLLDGVDEAADLKEVIEDYVCTELVPAGHPIVVTSRPEGVRLRLYKRNFVIMNTSSINLSLAITYTILRTCDTFITGGVLYLKRPSNTQIINTSTLSVHMTSLSSSTVEKFNSCNC